MVFIDGSTNSKGNGMGVILISPEGEETKLAKWLQFLMSNNEVEYETLSIGLSTTQNVEAMRVLVHLDSQLVVHQVNGIF